MLYAFSVSSASFSTFIYTTPPPPVIYTLSLHDALPICFWAAIEKATGDFLGWFSFRPPGGAGPDEVELNRSEEHTSELQSRFDLVCRLLLEKKNIGESSRYN